MNTILIVDDDYAICETLYFALHKKYQIRIAHSINEALIIFDKDQISISLIDLRIGNENGLDLFHKIKEMNDKSVVIIMTAFSSLNTVKTAVRDGVFDYIEKPIELSDLDSLIIKGLELYELRCQIDSLNSEIRKQYSENGIISESAAMKEVINKIEKVKNINANVLLMGESGTGKNIVAKAIHCFGNRRLDRFNVINCAAIPSNLLESELFGYKKGAFTGADKEKKGMFELSDKGTLMLDEIGEMDISLQSKLLRVIQEKEVLPIGSEKPVKTDVRIIAATNVNLLEAIDNKSFRADLYYRLNVININIPPLRDRNEDIPPLLKHFIYKYSKLLGKEISEVEPRFLEILMSYDFPGNIREMENIIERCIAFTEGKILKTNELLDYIGEVNGKNKDFHEKYLIPIFVGESLEDGEMRIIAETFKRFNNNQIKTAKTLGVTPKTLRSKLKKYNIHYSSDT